MRALLTFRLVTSAHKATPEDGICITAEVTSPLLDVTGKCAGCDSEIKSSSLDVTGK